MNLLLVASECVPLIKTGGLADVIGALPKALAPFGVHARILMPLYAAIRDAADGAECVLDLGAVHGGPARILATTYKGLDLLFLDAPHLFDRSGSIYLNEKGEDWPDNPIRFGALSLAGARVTTEGVAGWRPDVVHVHDWHAGLVPAYLRQAGDMTPCVMTIHNIAFQGLFEPEVCGPLGLSRDLFTPEGIEFYGRVSFLKAGITYSDKITTVSPTYARELMLPEFGVGLEGVLQSRKHDLLGILNGIDLDLWNPETDPHLVAPYSARSLKRKATNRTELEERFDLVANPDAPLFCVISRLTQQKGLDLLLDVLPLLVDRGARLAVLGNGEPGLEAAFRKAAIDYKGSVGVIIGYDEPRSHQMQAGADAILVPSRFEPCGLTQLYGLRYGTLPVVARTGGLADTVIDANEAALSAACATGVQFSPVTAAALGQAIDRTCDLFADKTLWQGMMRRAMRHPVGWDKSAKAYSRMFAGLPGIAETIGA
ncbi:glycogen synthase GlgA [Nioella nitratireducens]|uniref:glycogen synthase GlgA n=1 Tax=Nioella nitratireducens TaxID=1287720 RepID=UPI0008FCE3A9|nr:glycogen synthase GlgA [Nioella nitratireducens]